MSGLAQSESESISQNNAWSVRHRFEDGTYKSGYAPYGYSIEDGVYSINEDEAQWVRFIFDQVVKGYSCPKMAKLLTEKNAPTKKGGTWHTSSVYAILKKKGISVTVCFRNPIKTLRANKVRTTVKRTSSM